MNSSPEPAHPSGRLRRRLAVPVSLAILATGLLSAATPAQASLPGFCADGSQPYVPVATVESYSVGETVTGLSVTKGTTPEQFTGSYLGYIADALGTGKDMLLFRLSSSVIDGTGDLKAAGIWAGMSGSPVYDGDGNLIGAVAYSLNNDNLPVAGVTPAEYMKTIGSPAVSSSKTIRATSSNLKVTSAATRITGTSLAGSSYTPVKTVNVAAAAGGLQSELANTTLARATGSGPIARFLKSRSFRASGTSSHAVTQPLVAGGSIAATLSNGDFLTGSIGTVTAICGSTVYAFGHPMTFSGNASMQMSNASTALIVPDSSGSGTSFKQVSAFGAPVGMITQDRTFGIRGTIGSTHSFGVDVQVQNPAGATIAGYHSDVAEPQAGATTVAGLAATAATEQLDEATSGTARVSWRINYRRPDGTSASLSRRQVVDDPETFPYAVGSDVGSDVDAIVSNNFEDVAITGIQVVVKLISASDLNYTTARVQVLQKGVWRDLAGRTLKAKTRYSIRPVYLIHKNQKAAGTVAGPASTLSLKASARKSGWVDLTAAAKPAACSATSSGDINCSDLGSDTATQASSFDELIDLLSLSTPSDIVDVVTQYRLKKGKTVGVRSWTAPGVVTGDLRVPFSIRR